MSFVNQFGKLFNRKAAAPETQVADTPAATDETPQPSATASQALDLSVEPDITAGADTLAADAAPVS